MKKIFLVMAIFTFGFDAFSAPSYRASTTTGRNAATVEKNDVSRRASGRSAITPVAPTKQIATRASVATPGQSVSLTTGKGQAVTTRAAKQSVISTGTKVAAAATNTAIDEACWGKFRGCMDSFCMLDNANGGRCTCSDENENFNSILAEIQDLDNQSYQMATVGVERIEMGQDADAVMQQTAAITKSIEDEAAANKAKSKRKSLDLSAWNVMDVDFDEEEDLFGLGDDVLANKKGDALYRASAKLCKEQIPECKSQSSMMELMYKQQIRSDCTAYENSLRQQRTQSAQKLAAAQGAMREAALEQYRNANKYDLGQCTVAFKQCMQTTGGCGDDFTGCVTYDTAVGAVTDRDNKKKTVKLKAIKGASTSVSIAAWTYDVLDAKKTLCMGVTQQCVNVRDQVWDAFLREAAPQIKAAELTAESDLRTSCISNITQCFQKACKDNIDPNNPDGSYDMCLTRPETVEAVCKVQIEPCKKVSPNIMEYVNARLSAMRVDSCTKDFKECLRSEDRCGEDYSQCVGLDTDTIVDMCPTDKLVGCQYRDSNTNRTNSTNDIRERLAEVAQGIFLAIDNNLLKVCQDAVRKKVVEVCGSTSECSAFYDDEIIGTDSLTSSKKSNGDTVISGLMNFGLVKLDVDNGEVDTTDYTIIRNDGSKNIMQADDLSAVERSIKSSILTVKNKVEQKILEIEKDETISMCINGRDNRWRYTQHGTGVETGSENALKRFPNLLTSYKLMIFNSALEQAYVNYSKKYDEMVAKAMKEQSDDVKAMACAALAYDEDSLVCDEAGENCEQKGPLSSVLQSLYIGDEAGLSSNGLSYTIQGANLTAKLQVLSEGKSKTIIEDEKSHSMMSMVERNAVYSSGSGICTLTVVTTGCADTEVLETVKYKKKEKYRYYDDGTVKKYKCRKCEYEYNGTMCTEYKDPVTKEFEIEM